MGPLGDRGNPSRTALLVGSVAVQELMEILGAPNAVCCDLTRLDVLGDAV